jgi:hypothetical protein
LAEFSATTIAQQPNEGRFCCWTLRPLESYETAIKYISTTTTRTGLKVNAVLNKTPYETGEQVTEAEMQMLRIRAHKTLPEWNYTNTPQRRQRKM